jgi:hypothetical protein
VPNSNTNENLVNLPLTGTGHSFYPILAYIFEVTIKFRAIWLTRIEALVPGNVFEKFLEWFWYVLKNLVGEDT